MTECTGPVSYAETQAIVTQLRDLAVRAESNRQRVFHFVLAVGAESLQDNLDQLADMEEDSHE